MIGGLIAALFLQFGMAVTYALGASFPVAVTIVPLLAFLFIRKEHLPEEKETTLIIQVTGKHRDKVLVSAAIREAEAKELALNRERVKAYIDGKNLIRVIYVPNRVVNIVVA